ncbi:hypothetical protein, partial [Actinomyces sp. MRS3W]|uniref:hypothetical protein n=1 Tax=Actinomyces sp. MRS3W TaxID=2800796 RepID=UPI0028FD5571
MVKTLPDWHRLGAAHAPRHAGTSLRARGRWLSVLLALVLAAPLAGISTRAAHAVDVAADSASVG